LKRVQGEPPNSFSKPSPTWRTCLRNQAIGIDMFVVPSAKFRLLFVALILVHDRRKVVYFNVTRNLTAAWLSRQVTEACSSSPATGGDAQATP
jgi:hypothetical protein